MGLKEIPVLPSNYPLFDWADWPDSRAALVQGGETRKFQRLCWNAMVDCFVEAVEAAGLEVFTDEGVLTPDKIKMPLTTVYAPLTANRMNSFTKIIDDVIQFPWRWDWDNTFRGFINRRYFRASYNSNIVNIDPDIVYPEYFLEVVRQFNVILELMRGTFPTVETEVEHLSRLNADPGIRLGISVPVIREFSSRTMTSVEPLQVVRGLPFGPKGQILHSLTRANSATGRAGYVAVWQNSPVAIQVRGETIRPAPLAAARGQSFSKAVASLEFDRLVYTGARSASDLTANAEAVKALAQWFHGEFLAVVKSQARLDRIPPVATAARALTRFSAGADADAAAAQPGSAESLTRSKTQAALYKALPVTTAAQAKAASAATAAVNGGILGQLRPAKVPVKTQQQARMEAPAVAPMAAEQLSESKANLSILKPMARPGWAETLSGSRSSVSADRVEVAAAQAAQNSGSLAECTLDTAWEPPIWYEGGLWIRQARTIKILPDGSMDLSGSGDPIGANRLSGSIVSVAVDTAWLPPVWVDGGLFIRQVREVKVLADGSLDLSGDGEVFAVRQQSKVSVSCGLDTAWEPPVMVDGGLYIRQARVVQYENGELEVQ